MEKHVLFIGLGPHTRRIQYPYVIRKRKELNVGDIVTLDITAQQEAVKQYLDKSTPPDVTTHEYYTDSYIDVDLLDHILDTHMITHVVLGTDPEHHFEYAKYAISKSLKVIMDKPIVAIPNSTTDKTAATTILDQFRELDQLYQKYPKSNVVVLSQRRYHPAYNKIADDIVENYDRTGIIPHYFYLLHSDGQLRCQDEIDKITYHGFNRGYGKTSHSGYHFIDTLYLYLKYFIETKAIDNFALTAHQFTARDYSRQISPKSIGSIFKDGIETPQYEAISTGEIDAYVTIQLKKADQLIGTVRLDMLHSGFSDRINFLANTENLYKGNGRIRHEKQVVMQGPIYAAYIDSLQSKQIDLTENADKTSLGGEHHFELIRFNHCSNEKDVITQEGISDLMDIQDLGYSRGHQEEARYYSLDDFFASSDQGVRSTVSDLADHYISSLIMSSIYLALCTNQTIEKEV